MSDSSTPASVTIVDDHLLFATALADLVRALPDFTVAGVAGTGPDAIAAASEQHPDIILLDFHLPGVLATDILPELRAVSPQSRIIILTSDTSSATREAADAAGVDGFLTKEQALDDIADALRGALGGRGALQAEPARTEPADAEPAATAAAAAEQVEAVMALPVFEQPVAERAPAPAADRVEPVVEPPVVSAPRTASVAGLRRRQPELAIPAGGGVLVAIYGAKGGVGTTTVATNLGVTLARTGAPTVLVDLDLGFGDVGMFLDLEGGPSIADVALGRMDTSLLSRTALRHASGLRVVTTPSTPAPVRPEPSAVLAALEGLRAEFSYVLCDVPRVLGPLTVAVLQAVDLVVLVTTPELPALRDLERVLARGSLTLRSRGLLVVNRHPGQSGIALRDLEHGIGLPVGATIPSDGVAVTTAINRGVPLAGAETRLGRAFRDLADRVVAVVPARAKI